MARSAFAPSWAEIDVTAYGALHLTPAAGPVLSGEVPTMQRQQLTVKATTKAAKAKRGAKAVTGKDGTAEVPLTPADVVLCAALKAWRVDIAKDKNVPAFVIWHDHGLLDIARSKPKHKVALAAISRVEESRLLRFWETILATASANAAQHV